MDDQRDYEEERAQGAALREEQEAEVFPEDEGTEDRGQVDSSSKDYVGPEVAVEEQDEKESFTLAQIVAKEELDFPSTLVEALQLGEFGANVARQMKEVYDHGLDPEPDVVELKVTALESQALSVGLNLVTLFEPQLAEYAESLLRRAAEAVRDKPLDEERAAEIKRIMGEIFEEQTATMLGYASVEEYRAARKKADELFAKQEADEIDVQIDPEQGAPHLN